MGYLAETSTHKDMINDFSIHLILPEYLLLCLFFIPYFEDNCDLHHINK